MLHPLSLLLLPTQFSLIMFTRNWLRSEQKHEYKHMDFLSAFGTLFHHGIAIICLIAIIQMATQTIQHFHEHVCTILTGPVEGHT